MVKTSMYSLDNKVICVIIIIESLFHLDLLNKQNEPPHNKTNKMTVCPADAQTDLSLCFAHMPFIFGFVMRRLKYYPSKYGHLF